MAETNKSDASAIHAEEERLAHALISRGLLTREEYQQTKATPDGPAGAEALLGRLVKAGFLTANQSRRASQEIASLINQQIPGYQLMEKLGQGSMGTVFKARQLSMNRLVAVKVLLPRLCVNREFVERFLREAHTAAKLSHNNVVQAIDVGSAGPIHYFVMEYVEGKTIRQELDTGKVYEEKEAVEIIVQIAQALQHAHHRGLIHRDIKPANIILAADGIAKLADLGMARETSDKALAQEEKGMTIGTPYYMAPEQITGREDIDSRADIYGLGATLYHMITGRPPFPYKKSDQVFQAHLKEPLTSPDEINSKLSVGVGEVVGFMMAKKRSQRYQTPDDCIIDLDRLLSGRSPKLARQQIEAAMLASLAQGETDADAVVEDEEEEPEEEMVPKSEFWLWVGVLGVLLGVSFLVNLFLALR